MTTHKKMSWIPSAWDIFCVASVLGIWPRFCEPKILTTSYLKIPVKSLPSQLEGLKIAHISDLHFNENIQDCFLEKIKTKINQFQPDLIVITGDLFCYSECNDPDRFITFINSLKAPFGTFAVLGNHDYSPSITVNSQGAYDTTNDNAHFIKKGLKRIFSTTKLTGDFSPRLQEIKPCPLLVDLLRQTNCQLLLNETKCVPIKGSFLNISGTEEYSSSRLDIGKTFKDYNRKYPGLILTHNPDAVHVLKNSPGDLILSGHTHGGQINLPWIWKKLTLMEDQTLKAGLKEYENKKLYISRGVGSTFPFRLFAPPELVLLTLESSS